MSRTARCGPESITCDCGRTCNPCKFNKTWGLKLVKPLKRSQKDKRSERNKLKAKRKKGRN